MLGVGDQVVVNAHRAWRRGRIWKIDDKGRRYVGIMIPSSGEIRSVRVKPEDSEPFDPERIHNSRTRSALATPAPELLDILQALKRR